MRSEFPCDASVSSRRGASKQARLSWCSLPLSTPERVRSTTPPTPRSVCITRLATCAGTHSWATHLRALKLRRGQHCVVWAGRLRRSLLQRAGTYVALPELTRRPPPILRKVSACPALPSQSLRRLLQMERVPLLRMHACNRSSSRTASSALILARACPARARTVRGGGGGEVAACTRAEAQALWLSEPNGVAFWFRSCTLRSPLDGTTLLSWCWCVLAGGQQSPPTGLLVSRLAGLVRALNKERLWAHTRLCHSVRTVCTDRFGVALNEFSANEHPQFTQRAEPSRCGAACFLMATMT